MHCRWILYPLSHVGSPESILHLCSISFLSWELPCHYDASLTSLDAWEAESLSLIEEYPWLFTCVKGLQQLIKLMKRKKFCVFTLLQLLGVWTLNFHIIFWVGAHPSLALLWISDYSSRLPKARNWEVGKKGVYFNRLWGLFLRHAALMWRSCFYCNFSSVFSVFQGQSEYGKLNHFSE